MTIHTMKIRSLQKLLFTLTLLIFTSGCGYNQIQQLDEQINASWSEVLNQYQRRADLIPNLVNTVKGYAAHEEKVLREVTEARAKVSQMNVGSDIINDPQKLSQFQAAQAQMSGALSRLLVVSENYPQLKADASFRDLQVQLEGTENRITVARGRFIESVQSYNQSIRQFPTVVTAKVFGYQTRPNFSVENEKAISTAPQVQF